jgi:hypothetical protein
MYSVLKPFTTVNRRFSAEATPTISVADLEGCAMSLDTLLTKKFVAPVEAARLAAETATLTDEPAPVGKKKTAAV